MIAIVALILIYRHFYISIELYRNNSVKMLHVLHILSFSFCEMFCVHSQSVPDKYQQRWPLWNSHAGHSSFTLQSFFSQHGS